MTTGDGAELVLYRRGEELQIRVDGRELISTRASGSEMELARLACGEIASRSAPTVLVGGLGFGYTLRATLDLLPRTARVVVSEVFAAVVDWNRGPVARVAAAHDRKRRRRPVLVSLRAHRPARSRTGPRSSR